MTVKKSGRAQWIRKAHLLRQDEFVCSACGHTQSRKTDTCPACGSRLSGTKRDPVWAEEAELFGLEE